MAHPRQSTNAFRPDSVHPSSANIRCDPGVNLEHPERLPGLQPARVDHQLAKNRRKLQVRFCKTNGTGGSRLRRDGRREYPPPIKQPLQDIPDPSEPDQYDLRRRHKKQHLRRPNVPRPRALRSKHHPTTRPRHRQHLCFGAQRRCRRCHQYHQPQVLAPHLKDSIISFFVALGPGSCLIVPELF
jgi:hypothetical protein